MSFPEDHPVYKARAAHGWTLQDLASRTGCSVPLLSNIEHGYVPRPQTRDKIARELSVSTDHLWPPGSGV